MFILGVLWLGEYDPSDGGVVRLKQWLAMGAWSAYVSMHCIPMSTSQPPPSLEISWALLNAILSAHRPLRRRMAAVSYHDLACTAQSHPNVRIT